MRTGASVVLLIVVTLVAAPALAYTATDGTGVAATATNGSDGPNATLGSKLSAFMQSNDVAAESSVTTGTWRAAVRSANASERAEQVARRVTRLERRLQRVRDRLADLHNRSVGTDGPAAAGQAARLITRARSLRDAINETDRVAERVGVNDTRLDRLRQQAANLSGPEVAAIARTLSLGPPGDVSRGPPAGVPGGPSANGTGGPPANVTRGPPDQTSPGPPGNGTEAPPETERSDGENGPAEPPGNGSQGSPDGRNHSGNASRSGDGQVGTTDAEDSTNGG